MATTPQSLKPATVAKKLGVYLPAMPEQFRETPITRDEYNELQSEPPEWLSTLRREGPHPKHEVARKLGISVSGLARAGVTGPLTTAEIKDLLAAPPEWLVVERASFAAVREEEAEAKAAAKFSGAKGSGAKGSGGSGTRGAL